jgi:hypothetical protein
VRPLLRHLALGIIITAGLLLVLAQAFHRVQLQGSLTVDLHVRSVLTPLELMPGVLRGVAGSCADVPNRLTEFMQHLVRKNRGATRNLPPPGLSDNTVLVSSFFVLLRILRPYLEGEQGTHCSLSNFPAGLMFLQVTE